MTSQKRKKEGIIITKILQDPDQIKNRKGKGNKFKSFLPMMSMQGVNILKKEKRRNNYIKNSVSSPNQKSKRKGKKRRREKKKIRPNDSNKRARRD